MRFVSLLIGLLACIAQPALAQNPRLQSLEQRLATMLAENPGEYGFAALNLTTGESISVNGNERFPMASTMKIAVAAAYLADVDAGIRTLDDTIKGVRTGRLMDVMITRSDNGATDLLMDALGGPAAIDGWLRARNISDMRVDRTIAQLLSDRRDLRDIRDSSTPRAMLELLRLIDGAALKPESRAILLDMMRRCATGSNRIRGILPPGAQVEHKTGTLSGYTGDVGFLITPKGHRIAIALFARGGSNRPAVIATTARAIYDAFETDSATSEAVASAVGAAAPAALTNPLPGSGAQSSMVHPSSR